MARRKANIRSKPHKSPKRKGTAWWRKLFHFIALPQVRVFILIAIIVAALFWFQQTLSTWTSGVVELFGWGPVLLVIAFSILLGAILKRRLSSLIYHWNWWLGGASFTLAIWGILGFLGHGGSFGLSITRYDIVGYPIWLSILHILGLVGIGVILVAPRACFRLAASMLSWLAKGLKGRPVPKPQVQEKPISPQFMPKPTIPATEPEREAVTTPPQAVTTPTAIPTLAQGRQELRQVAQEVWKKYGESPSLITIDGWKLPPIDILDVTPEVEFAEADNLKRATLLEEALASYGVEAKVVQINTGPAVTQFGVEPGWDRKFREKRERDKDGSIKVKLEEVSKTRVKVDRITSLANDLALALAAPSIRIEAPVPGKSMVGIEVPNTDLSLVSLRGVIETNVFQRIASRSKLAMALGKGAGGEAIAADLARMPHLLIAGATGSGKTVCLNSIICCFLLHNTPNDLRFIMIDPKRVELTPYNSIPHLATPVIVDTNKALAALRWLNSEMDSRYQKIATAGARNIEGYNKNKQGTDRSPYLVLVIDELADLMMAGFDEVEHILCRLAQLARATGIYLVVATQRPSVDVVTGLIKANFPTRISFAVTSQVDSRTILDSAGAEKLLGRGDMLYRPTEAAKPKRLQGCFVSEAETERLVYFWGSQRVEEAAELKGGELVSPVTTFRIGEYPEDPLLDAVKQLAHQYEHISTSFLQRKLHIGYPRAARLMEQFEEEMEKEA